MGWLDTLGSGEDADALITALREQEKERLRLTESIARAGVGQEATTGQPIAPVPIGAEGGIQSAYDLLDYQAGDWAANSIGPNEAPGPSPEAVRDSAWLQEALKDTPIREPGVQAIKPFMGHTMLQSGTAQQAAKLPFVIGQLGLSLGPAQIGRALGWEGPAKGIDWLREASDTTSKAIKSVIGTGPESDPSARLLEWGGEMTAPAGSLTVPLTAANVMLDWITGDEKTLGERINPNDATVPPDQLPAQPPGKGSPYPDWLGSAIAAPVGDYITGAANTAYKFVTHTPETVMDTRGGPATVKTSELYIMGGLAVASLGMMIAPSMIGRLRSSNLPSFRPVDNASPGTMAISSPLDLARTYDDVNAGVLRLARRAGVDPVTMDRMTTTFQYQTRMGAQAVADSAVLGGRAVTPNFTFQAPVAIADLNATETPQMARYLHLRDTFDDINAQQTRITLNNAPQTGPITVRGHTLPDVINEMRTLEAGYPEVRAFSDAYRQNLQEMRRFESTGEYSTVSRREAARQNAENANQVPFRGQRVMGEDVERGSPTAVMAETQRVRMRQRLENEAAGMYVDAVRQVQPDLFRRVTNRQLRENPHWVDNTVTIYRRGIPERYTTDPFIADVLKMDPYYITGMGAQAAYMMKRVMESTTTGAFAPWFAPTSLFRNWQISKFAVTDPRLRSPGLLTSLEAIPRQLLPQLAQAVSSSLERGGTLGWLRGISQNPQWHQGIDGLMNRLAVEYDRSLFAQLRSAGSHKGSILEQQTQASNALTRAIESMPTGPFQAIWSAYKSTLEAIHNAPSFAFARKNYNTLPLPDLALAARRLTGDPRTGGQYLNSRGRPIGLRQERPGDPTSSFSFGDRGVTHTVGGGAARFYGAATELGRAAVPWFNATTQGIKRIGEAYLENPARFVGKAWLYAGMPAAATYLMSRALDKDPNGLNYVDYMMNRRSDYKKTMNYYIPIPGRPAEEGIEFPRFHELAGFSRLMEASMDHMFRSSIFTEKEDFTRTLQSIFNVAIEPPVPPAFTAWDATRGGVSTGGAFAGEFYKRKQQPYDQTGGLPQNIELIMRALAPGLGDVIGAGSAAFIQTPKGVGDSITNALKEAGKRVISKTPVVRDITGIQAPVTGNTPVTDELFKRQTVIKQLSDFYSEWTKSKGLINIKPKSEAGGNLAASVLGDDRTPTVGPLDKKGKSWMAHSAGLNQPEPTNPLYNMFIEEVYAKFKKDNPSVTGDGADAGGIGFQSMWARYGDATKNVTRLRNINAGNYVTWQRQLDERPEQRKYLEENNVDTKNLNQVRNFYEKVRQDTGRVILFTIRGVEYDFSQRVGKPIKLEDINPYGKGLQTEDQSQADPLSDVLSTPY